VKKAQSDSPSIINEPEPYFKGEKRLKASRQWPKKRGLAQMKNEEK
jgi:hypothetical protein